MTGASGGLGAALIPLLRKRRDTLILTDVGTMDVGDLPDVLKVFNASRPDLVFHLAAATDVDRCEREPEYAYRVNVLGTNNVATTCQKYDIPLVYVSTAEVFDGKKKTPYTEQDKPNPVNEYARTKFEGEKAVQRLLKKYFIVRTAWLVGGGKNDKKFVGKFLRLLDTQKIVKVVSDKIGSPTFADDLAANLLLLVDSGRYGLYHMCNKGHGSRYDMAREILKSLKIKNVELVAVSSKEFPAPAKRGRSEAIKNRKLGLLGLDRMPEWKKSLRKYLKKEFQTS